MVLGGFEISLPIFFPSVSSCAKTNVNAFYCIDLLAKSNIDQFLISAYDIYHLDSTQQTKVIKILNQSINNDKIILLDSGNYESYWKADTKWTNDKFHKTLEKTPHQVAFCFDEQNPPEKHDEISNLIAERIISDQHYSKKGTIIPIIHAPSLVLVDVIKSLVNSLNPLMIGIPERVLGDGIIERAKTLIKIRHMLNKFDNYYPIHLLGTDNPLSLLVFSICGADSFDGLIWCQTAVDYNTALLHHFHQREMFNNKPLVPFPKGLNYTEITLIHNLFFYEIWMNEIRQALKNNTIDLLIDKYNAKSYLDNIFNQLSEVIK